MIRAALIALGLILAMPAKSATFVLVHGAYQDANAWGHVVQTLTENGHTVRAIDLPGHGRNRASAASLTLAHYRDAVMRVVATSREKVILVGHGSSGVVISAVAEAIPERIASLVYVSAYLPKDGQSIMDLSLADRGKAITVANWQTDRDKTIGAVAAPDRAAVFCGDCNGAFQAYILQHFQPEPLRPMSDKVRLTQRRFGQVPKAYVFTTLNRAISPAHQRAMAADPRIRSYTMNTSHSPFFTQPDNLSAILMAEARR